MSVKVAAEFICTQDGQVNKDRHGEKWSRTLGKSIGDGRYALELNLMMFGSDMLSQLKVGDRFEILGVLNRHSHVRKDGSRTTGIELHVSDFRLISLAKVMA